MPSFLIFIVKILEMIYQFLSDEGGTLLILKVAIYKVLLVFGILVSLYDASVMAESPCSAMLWLQWLKLVEL